MAIQKQWGGTTNAGEDAGKPTLTHFYHKQDGNLVNVPQKNLKVELPEDPSRYSANCAYSRIITKQTPENDGSLHNHKWIKYDTNIRKFYAPLKENEIVTFEGKWIKLEIIMLSKISQTQKGVGYFLTYGT